MKEYKIICDQVRENIRTGKKDVLEGVQPIIGKSSARFTSILKTKKEADAYLKEVKAECEEHDSYVRNMVEQYGAKAGYDTLLTQSNIHIVSRTVTEWR